MKLRLEQRWCLVTGASSGIGRELALQLAARGANLILSARSEESLLSLAAEIGSAFGVGTRVVPADLAHPEGVRALVEGVEALDLPVAHLINNAGYGSYGPLREMDPDDQAKMIRLNCEALVRLTRHFLPKMAARGEGGVLNVGSTAGFQASPLFATYAATKAFVISFTEAVAEEQRGSGVRVMVLCPGPVPTGFQERAAMTIPKGLRASVLSASETAASALSAYESSGVVTYVPGAINRVGAVLSQLAPRAWVTRLTAQLMKDRG